MSACSPPKTRTKAAVHNRYIGAAVLTSLIAGNRKKRPEAVACRCAGHALVAACLAMLAVSCADVPDPAGTASGADAAIAAGAEKKSDAAAVNSDPEQLAGLDHGGLTGLLGEPVFLRNDGPAELWRYRHESCVLDLYLYSDRGEPSRGPRVRHFDVRSPSGKKNISARDCLAALLRARLPG